MGNFGYGSSGSVRVTADSVVGKSGGPVRIWSATFLNAGSAGTFVLRNGTSASGDVYIQQIGSAASTTDTINFEGGLRFPDGCFFDKDTNVTSAVIEVSHEA